MKILVKIYYQYEQKNHKILIFNTGHSFKASVKMVISVKVSTLNLSYNTKYCYYALECITILFKIKRIYIHLNKICIK